MTERQHNVLGLLAGCAAGLVCAFLFVWYLVWDSWRDDTEEDWR